VGRFIFTARPHMSFINIEIKARTVNTDFIRQYLLKNGAEERGIDFQTDTYFNAGKGRLKLREGNIENNLIYYEREDNAGPKQSNFSLLQVVDAPALKNILSKAIGVKIKVEKKREIYFIKNVKFHLDYLEGLGNFVEIEASNKYADLSLEQLNAQCVFYVDAFGIAPEDLLNTSYSDMLLQNL
jgi:adenylate cyclase, class 2